MRIGGSSSIRKNGARAGPGRSPVPGGESEAGGGLSLAIARTFFAGASSAGQGVGEKRPVESGSSSVQSPPSRRTTSARETSEGNLASAAHRARAAARLAARPPVPRARSASPNVRMARPTSRSNSIATASAAARAEACRRSRSASRTSPIHRNWRVASTARRANSRPAAKSELRIALRAMRPI